MSKKNCLMIFSFSCKVISYFNPAKYWAHWEKTKTQNPILHNTTFSNSNTNNKRFISDIKETFAKTKANSFRSNGEFENFKSKNNVHYNYQPGSSTTLTTRNYQNGKLKANGDLTNFYQKQQHHHHHHHSNSEQVSSDDKPLFSSKKNSNDSASLKKSLVQTASKNYNHNMGRRENDSILY